MIFLWMNAENAIAWMSFSEGPFTATTLCIFYYAAKDAVSDIAFQGRTRRWNPPKGRNTFPARSCVRIAKHGSKKESGSGKQTNCPYSADIVQQSQYHYLQELLPWQPRYELLGRNPVYETLPILYVERVRLAWDQLIVICHRNPRPLRTGRLCRKSRAGGREPRPCPGL